LRGGHAAGPFDQRRFQVLPFAHERVGFIPLGEPGARASATRRWGRGGVRSAQYD
jgi:hypothetical protein